MHWIQRTLRAFRGPVVVASRRYRPRFDSLEDRTTPTAAAAITGSIFYDVNGNAANDGSNEAATGLIGDFAVGGTTVTLTGTTDLGTAVNNSVVTRANGTFEFVKLEPGIYQVAASTGGFSSAVGGPGNLGGDASGGTVRTIVVSQGQVESGLKIGMTGIPALPGELSLRQFFNNYAGEFAGRVRGVAASQTAGSGRTIVDGTTGAAATGTASLEGNVTLAGSSAGLAGIDVRLTGVDGSNVPYLLSTTTNASGHYRFSNLARGTYFIDVIPDAGHRAAGATVGSLGGSAPRADQLAPTVLANGSVGTGFDFVLAAFTGDLAAGLANDVAGGSLGSSSDGKTSDPTIRGRLVNPAAYTSLEARFAGGDFVSVKSSLAADGSFVLNEQTLRDVFGGGFPDGAYVVEIRATSTSGTVLTTSVAFSLDRSGPSFLNAFANITNPASAANTQLILAGAFADPDIANSLVTFNVLKGATPMQIDVELFDKDAPRTVANFFNHLDRYAASGGTLFHRLHLEPGLEVLQGGGFNFNDATNTINPTHIPQDDPIRNEFSTDRPNLRGTIATAKASGNPDSATSEFFFNLDDANAPTLGVNNNGGFTVFGRTLSDDDLAVLDDLAGVPIKNTGGQPELPLVDGNTLDENNVLRVQNVAEIFRDGELTYTATSSNPSVAAVTVGGFQGNTLTIDYLAAGTSTITVTATDSTLKTATTTFVVTVT